MNANKLIKSVMWGISTIIGIAVAESIYRAGTVTIDKRKLIGDCEVISDVIEEDNRE